VISGLNKLSTKHEVEWTYSSTILDLELEVSVQLHHPAALPPRKTAPGSQRVGGWVGPETVWLWGRVNFSCPYPESNPHSSVVKPVVYPLYRLNYHSSCVHRSMILKWILRRYTDSKVISEAFYSFKVRKVG
jgi:hypothetical protein